MDTKTRVPGRKRLLIAGGALLGAASLVTAAAFTDFANLNLGNGTDDSGIGGNNRFNIQVVGTDADGNPVAGTWQEADTEAGVNINVPGSQLITPGDTISVAIPFRNESPALSADISFSLQDRPGYTSDPAMVAALRYTITLDGTDIVTDATQATVDDLDLGTYLTGEQGTLEVAITLPDQGSAADNNALQGQVSYVQAHFDAISVQP
ncbi:MULTISPECIES: hypothetical protein [Microbacterium]|uniref:Alternate-type signal peptide domain-containing protein n=1 Tax=Microbacterium hominis TaxID=162426 RepID=A0A2K9DBP3_9MICO|nr:MULTISPECIES: hypothetical protein [Microbacterium]AUG30985.1 hypothetical protein CXR34_16945 [Microbacterium hominis]